MNPTHLKLGVLSRSTVHRGPFDAAFGTNGQNAPGRVAHGYEPKPNYMFEFLRLWRCLKESLCGAPFCRRLPRNAYDAHRPTVRRPGRPQDGLRQPCLAGRRPPHAEHWRRACVPKTATTNGGRGGVFRFVFVVFRREARVNLSRAGVRGRTRACVRAWT